jgi:hypothetical protein
LIEEKECAMLTNVCWGLTILTIPVLIELFRVQAGLNLSATGHTIAELLIVVIVGGLIWKIGQLDYRLYLRNCVRQDDAHSDLKKRRTL